MKTTWLLVIAAACPAAGACEYLESAPVSAVAAAPTKSSISVLKVVPAAGSEVARDTVIEIDLEYRIAGFEVGSFFLNPQFETVRRGSSSDGALARQPALTRAHGVVHLCLPLAASWDAAQIAWPRSLRVLLNREMGGGSSRGEAWTDNIQFPSSSAPAEVLAAQRLAPPVEVMSALERVQGSIDDFSARHEVCVQRFPEQAAKITAAYRAWEARNDQTIVEINELYFKELMRGTGDSKRGAATILDYSRKARVDDLRRRPLEALQMQCDDLLAVHQHDESIDSMHAAQLKTVRAWTRRAQP